MEKLILFLKWIGLYEVVRRIHRPIYKIFSKNGYIRNYIFSPIGEYARKKHIWPFYGKNCKKIESYKDKYENQCCVVIGNGPSLTIEDLEQLEGKNIITFGTNGIFNIFDKTTFRPTFYIALDDSVVKKLTRKRRLITDDIPKENAFINTWSGYRKCKKTIRLYVNWQNYWVDAWDDNFDYYKGLKSSPDFVAAYYPCHTITNCAIELAMYMGFREIYLIGVDCSYTGKKAYFYEKEETDYSKNMLLHKAQNMQVAGYKFVYKDALNRGCNIYNATRGGKLEVFERVDFDKVFKN